MARWLGVEPSDELNRRADNHTAPNPSGIFTVFPVPTPDSFPLGIAPGPDGNEWFTEYGSHQPASAEGERGEHVPTGLAPDLQDEHASLRQASNGTILRGRLRRSGRGIRLSCWSGGSRVAQEK